jgi:hypothetical protein
MNLKNQNTNYYTSIDVGIIHLHIFKLPTVKGSLSKTDIASANVKIVQCETKFLQ